MVTLILKNRTGKRYDEFRNEICEHLVGCPAFINNSIMVSDDRINEDAVVISLGDRDEDLELRGVIETDELFDRL